MSNRIISTLVASSLSLPAIPSPRFIDRDSIDNTNITCMDYRCYSTRLGHFISQDPLKKQYSQYQYGKANPIKYSDPSGQAGIDGLLEETGAVLVMAITVVVTVVSEGAATPVLGSEIEGMGALTSESVTTVAQGLLDVSQETASTVESTEGATNEVISSMDSTGELSTAESGSDMQMDNPENDPRIQENTPKETTEKYTGVFNEKPPESDDSYESEPEEKEDNTHEKEKEPKDEKQGQEDKGDKDKPKDKPKGIRGLVRGAVDFVKGAKEMIFFGGLSFAPEIISKLKPAPVPPSKPPSLPK